MDITLLSETLFGKANEFKISIALSAGVPRWQKDGFLLCIIQPSASSDFLWALCVPVCSQLEDMGIMQATATINYPNLKVIRFIFAHRPQEKLVKGLN